MHFFDLFNGNDTNLIIKRTKKKETHDYSLNKTPIRIQKQIIYPCERQVKIRNKPMIA